uniref:C2H2-type domain-containing protein n=1 Tax=Trichogramma kaykai TaxID=54128 RepID=A0ABD2XNI9_9HYME
MDIIEDNDYTCHLRPEKFERDDHPGTQIKSVGQDRTNYLSDVSKKTFAKALDVAHHEKTVHGEKKAVHERRGHYLCDECQEIFVSWGNLARHYKTVHNEQKHNVFDVYQKTFASKKSLPNHHKSVHREGRDYENDVFEKTFSVQSDMAKHKKSIHEGRKYYEVFSEQSNVKEYENIVQDEQIKYVPEVCTAINDLTNYKVTDDDEQNYFELHNVFRKKFCKSLKGYGSDAMMKNNES